MLTGSKDGFVIHVNIPFLGKILAASKNESKHGLDAGLLKAIP